MKLKNAIFDKSKTYFVKKTNYHLFGTDFDLRESMSSEDAVRHFDEVWQTEIASAVLNGSKIGYEEAVEFLGTEIIVSHCVIAMIVTTCSS